MIKGCSKRVVYLKNTDSAIFEEAYFVLGRGDREVKVSDRDMLSSGPTTITERAE